MGDERIRHTPCDLTGWVALPFGWRWHLAGLSEESSGIKDAWSWESKVGLADATGTLGSQSPLPSPGCYPPRLPGMRHTGWLSREEGNSLSPLPSPALVPGQAIFGPPRPVLDKKGTGVGPFHPTGTHCSIRGLTYGLPDPRAQGGWVRALLPGLTVSRVWGKSANGLCSGMHQSLKAGVLGGWVCS